MDDNKKSFQYTYSAEQQEELLRIQEKYRIKKPEENKMEQLRRLDNSVTKGATTVSLIIGIVSCLVMGAGMSFVMAFENRLLLGIVIGVVGIAWIISAYPVYCYIAKKQRKRVAPEILRLTEELMK